MDQASLVSRPVAAASTLPPFFLMLCFHSSLKPFVETDSGFITRVWQHEFDHLNGILLTDRMGPVAKMQNRKKLKELEDKYNSRR